MAEFQVRWQVVGESFLKLELIPSIHVTEVISYMWGECWVQVCFFFITFQFALNFKNLTKLESSLPKNEGRGLSKSLNSKPEMDDLFRPAGVPPHSPATGEGK